ncbi:MAG: GNAT family N-acetyltransferase [Gemmobacter sp.]
MLAPALPALPALFQAMDDTWPAAALHRVGPWLVREGQGGGKRVSAATAEAPVTEADIPLAEARHRALGQTPLFLIRPGDEALDAMLEARGYRVVDPVHLRAAPLGAFAEPDLMYSFPHWPPMAMCEDVWAETGIGPGRQAVMRRVKGPATAFLACAPDRIDRVAGAGFAAISGQIAMIHAVEVLPRMRRQGSAHNILRSAAWWAQTHGAHWLALAVTCHNEAAGKLYASLNMSIVGHYHYRSA